MLKPGRSGMGQTSFYGTTLAGGAYHLGRSIKSHWVTIVAPNCNHLTEQLRIPKLLRNSYITR